MVYALNSQTVFISAIGPLPFARIQRGIFAQPMVVQVSNPYDVFISDEPRRTLRILFAEDHEPTRKFLAAVMRNAGYLLDVTIDGRAALQLFEKNFDAYDVVVTDHEMPHLNGLELVQKLRAARFPGSVVVVSGGLSFENAAAYAKLEVDQVLSKPISGRALIEAIRAVEPGNKLPD